jgi:hypothetical protein
MGAFPAPGAGNRAIRSNSSQTAPRFAPVFPLLSLARLKNGVLPFFSFEFLRSKNSRNYCNRHPWRFFK